MTDWLIDRLCAWDPLDRRRWAMRLLVWSFVLGAANLMAWAVGFVSDSVMLAVTTALSWLALTLTMLDVVITADVRVAEDED